MRFWKWLKKIWERPGVMIVKTGCSDEHEEIGFPSNFARRWPKIQEPRRARKLHEKVDFASEFARAWSRMEEEAAIERMWRE